MTPDTIKAVSEALTRVKEFVRPWVSSDGVTLREINKALALLAADQAKAPPDRERLAGQIAQLRKWLGYRAAKTELSGFEMLASTIADACDDLLRLSPATAGEEMRERAAKVADAHRARIANHNPDDQSGDLVAHGYGNAALNIAVEIRRLS